MTISSVVPPLAGGLHPVPTPAARTNPAPASGPADPLRDVVPSFVPKPLEGPAAASDSFESVLSRFIGEVQARQTAASQAVQGLLGGQGVPLHQAMIAVEEAAVSFQLMVEVRNRLLEAYQELMRMQV